MDVSGTESLKMHISHYVELFLLKHWLNSLELLNNSFLYMHHHFYSSLQFSLSLSPSLRIHFQAWMSPVLAGWMSKLSTVSIPLNLLMGILAQFHTHLSRLMSVAGECVCVSDYICPTQTTLITSKDILFWRLIQHLCSAESRGLVYKSMRRTNSKCVRRNRLICILKHLQNTIYRQSHLQLVVVDKSSNWEDEKHIDT